MCPHKIKHLIAIHRQKYFCRSFGIQIDLETSLESKTVETYIEKAFPSTAGSHAEHGLDCRQEAVLYSCVLGFSLLVCGLLPAPSAMIPGDTCPSVPPVTGPTELRLTVVPEVYLWPQLYSSCDVVLPTKRLARSTIRDPAEVMPINTPGNGCNNFETTVKPAASEGHGYSPIWPWSWWQSY